MVLMTLLNIVFFYWAIGENPTGLKLGIVSDEIRGFGDCKNKSLITAFAHDFTCDFNKISCRFIDEISDEYADKIFFTNADDAYEAVKRGKIMAFLHMKSNFTESSHAALFGDFDEFSPERSNQFIDFYLDQTDFQLFVFLERKIFNAYDNYSRSLMKDCGLSANLGSSPMKFEKPIFGNLESNFKLFMAPVFLMVMVFFQSLNSNTTSICDDRKNGLWNRTMLSGVTPAEILLSHFVVQLFFNLIQIVEILVFLSTILQTSDISKLLMISTFLMLLLFAGMGAGMAISCLTEDFSKAFNLNNFLLNISITVAGEINLHELSNFFC
jgi:ABC-2 family transporter protein